MSIQLSSADALSCCRRAACSGCCMPGVRSLKVRSLDRPGESLSLCLCCVVGHDAARRLTLHSVMSPPLHRSLLLSAALLCATHPQRIISCVSRDWLLVLVVLQTEPARKLPPSGCWVLYLRQGGMLTMPSPSASISILCMMPGLLGCWTPGSPDSNACNLLGLPDVLHWKLCDWLAPQVGLQAHGAHLD